MTTGTRLITAEELWAMPNNRLLELVRGEVRTMAPAGFEHGAVVMNISAPLATYVKSRRLGVVLGAETGFVLKRNPDIVRGADVAFVSAARIPAGRLTVKFWEGPPDLAVEVISPSDVAREIEERVADYLDAGTRLVWVVKTNRKTVTVRRPGESPTDLRVGDTLDGADVVPGFRLDLSNVFG